MGFSDDSLEIDAGRACVLRDTGGVGTAVTTGALLVTGES